MAFPSHTRRQFIAYGVAVGIGLTAGCVSVEENTQMLSDLKTYKNKEYAYTVLYPESLTLVETNPNSVQFSTDPYDGWMAVTTEEINSEANAELAADVWESSERLQENYELLERHSIDLPNEHSGVVLETTFSTETGERQQKTLWVVDAHSHAIMIQHTENDYTDQFDEMATKILRSFTLS